MKAVSIFLALGGLTSSIGIPDEKALNDVRVESHSRKISSKTSHDLTQASKSLIQDTEEAYDSYIRSPVDDLVSHALDKGSNALDAVQESYTASEEWLSSELEKEGYVDSADVFSQAQAPSDHHHEPNQTIYQLIANSKYTTELAKLLDDYPDLVEKLNGTEANYTVFAPTNYAFEKIPEHAPKPSKEQLEKILTYHISSDFYPAGRVLVSKTIPTLLDSPNLPGPQRLFTNIGLRGLTVDFYSRIIAINIFGTNGVIHGLDSILIPPPKVQKVITFFPGQFSTLELGLRKADLFDQLGADHVGGTFFAPSNFAFRKLGFRINAFLFSKYGEKYLKALLKYHIVPEKTLYSDAFYEPESSSQNCMEHRKVTGHSGSEDDSSSRPPKGVYHYELPTLLEGKSLSADVARYGRFIEIRVNGFSTVDVPDGVAKDGVIQTISNVLVPPKQGHDHDGDDDDEDMSSMTIEDLIERLEPYV